jgi:hypothetical protein
MLTSSWRTVPAAAFRAFANGSSPAAISFWFSSWNAGSGISTSPRIATVPAAGGPSWRSLSGMARIVRRFSVTSSPISPSPRVEPRANKPSSYTSSIESPSNLGSAM